jgi:quercetin dioxygenase-like cupin family protein
MAEINIYRAFKMGKETFHPMQTNDKTFKMDWWLEKGGGVPPHIHYYMDEHFEVLSGKVTFLVDGKKIIKHSGETLLVPKGVKHGIKNESSETISVRVIYSPEVDVIKMFKIIACLDETNSGSTSNMIKYFYLYPRLGLKSFSEIPSKGVMSFMHGLLGFIGMLAGWKKLVTKIKPRIA